MLRPVFHLSDRTGITAELLGRALLGQFSGLQVQRIALPFIASEAQAHAAVARIREEARRSGERPIVFSTMINARLREIVASVRDTAIFVDFFDAFIDYLAGELEMAPSGAVGTTHGVSDPARYVSRINAVHFALDNDDGATTRHYDRAELILVGVSRTGKTPACLYLGLQYGIHAANYPFTDDDLETTRLPPRLRDYRDRLFGLTIDPERLSHIRSERLPGSRYATLQQCRFEISQVEMLYRKERIPFLDTTEMSVEEIAATIVHQVGLERRF